MLAMLALMLLTVLFSQRPPLAAQADNVAARLQRFEDKDEIQALLLDYGRHLDNRDFAAYGRLFASQAAVAFASRSAAMTGNDVVAPA